MKAIPLALHQSVHVQPGQRSGAARAPDLQPLKLVESFVEPSGEMSLVSCYLLQGLLVRQEALPSHVPKFLLHLLRFPLRPFHLEPGTPGGSLQQVFRPFLSGLGDGLYDRTHQPGGPALVAFPRVTVGKTGHRDTLEQFLWVDLSFDNLIGTLYCIPDNAVGVDGRKALVVFHLDEALEELVILFIALGVAAYSLGVVRARLESPLLSQVILHPLLGEGDTLRFIADDAMEAPR